ncbi:MAG: glycosyltransferase family 39 protein [Chloroflexi bacterium]|nr:glycosyltransferase family 39 protein [Chloroflexota bacterium]
MLPDRLRKNSQLIAMIIAVISALAAQYLFTGEIFTHQKNSNTWVWETKYTFAVLLLVLAAACSAWATFRREKAKLEDETTPLLDDGIRRRRIWLVAAGGCYLSSILIYLTTGENSWVRMLWMAGIALLLIPFWMQTWGKPDGRRIPTWEWLLLSLIVLIGFGFRYWKLTEVPSHVDNDVALMGTFGVDLIEAENYNWIGYSNSEHLLSYDQFMAWRMRLFRQNHYGIVMPSVVLGTLTLIFVFLLGRKLSGPLVGFMAVGLLTISYTHIHFSRILFGNSSFFMASFAVYAIFKGMRTRQPFWFTLAGVLTGWGLLLYDSSRVIPVLIVSIIIWQALWHRQQIKSMYKDWLVLGAGVLFAFGPMLAYAAVNFSNFAGRANKVLLWEDVVWQHQLASYHTESPFVVLVEQTWRTFLTLHLTGDGSPHFAFQRPMVSSLTAMFFILGLGYALTRLKNIRLFAMLAWIFLTFILGGVLTADPPYWPHLNIALPPIMLVAALGIESLADALKKAFGRVGYMVYVWVLIGVLVVTGVNNWQVYYDYVKNNAGNRIRIARYLNSLPSSYYVYLASDAFPWGEHAFRFFSRDMEGQDLDLAALESEPPALDRPTVFILFRHPEVIPVLQRLYPDGVLENHYDFDNLVSFISYRVVPSTADVTPESAEISQLSSGGWQLIFLFIVLWIGYVAYNHYSMQEANGKDG